MNIARRAMQSVGWLLTAGSAAIVLGAAGCGGGGGGGTPPAQVVGRILVLNEGTPPTLLTGAKVNIGGKTATTGADGVFSIPNAPSNATTVAVTAASIKPLTQTITALTPATGTPPPVNDLGDLFVIPTTSDATYTANIKSSVVKASDKSPIAGAKVRVMGQTVTTDANGAFTITGLPTGIDVSAGIVGVITAPGFANTNVVLDLPLGTGDNNLPPFEMVPPVGDQPPGQPSDIRGKVSIPATETGPSTVTLIDKTSGAIVGTTQTAADGTYGFFVVAGTYTITAQHPNLLGQGQDITLVSPDQPVTVNFTLTP